MLNADYIQLEGRNLLQVDTVSALRSDKCLSKGRMIHGVVWMYTPPPLYTDKTLKWLLAHDLTSIVIDLTYHA